MKQNPIYYTLTCLALVWVVYALLTQSCLACEKIVYYLIPHLVFLLLFVGFLCLYHKSLQSAYKNEEDSKMADLGRKLTWEREQFELSKKRKQFEVDINKEKRDYDQLLTFVKEFKGKEGDTIQAEVEKLQKDIEMLKSKKDIFIDIVHKTFENNTTSNKQSDGNTENNA